MTCPRCQHENPVDATFCVECGARLEAACSACGEPNWPGAKFCRKCGQPLIQTDRGSETNASRFTSPERYTPKHLAERILNSKAALEGERKQVTVLFADLKGSMELLADRDPEEARKILDPVLEGTFAVHAATWGKSRESSRRRTDSPIQLWEPVTLHERAGRQSILFDTVRRGT